MRDSSVPRYRYVEALYLSPRKEAKTRCVQGMEITSCLDGPANMRLTYLDGCFMKTFVTACPPELLGTVKMLAEWEPVGDGSMTDERGRDNR
ncbi:hypothetical protein LCGC14_0552240 [marine sediment metagenome]|uniref:Uncharacterized protein n=1 Tax=marine sediment metagenome TaxID=412755 RepID=A0A0F9UAW1_9ZZZZ